MFKELFLGPPFLAGVHRSFQDIKAKYRTKLYLFMSPINKYQ